MAATLRAGLSMGLSGFTFWSHDIGGFVQRASRDLYSRWLPFGALTSHTRTHGAPPREPWEYDDAMVVEFQHAIGLKYALMPYILAQAKRATNRGLPMMRALFIEYPDDPASWFIDDQYLFGEDLLVAPLFDESRERDVYLPPGGWIDYQSGERFQGARWHRLRAGEIPIVLMVRAGAVVPHVEVAQNTDAIDWTQMELKVFGDGPGEGWVALPESDAAPVQVSSEGRIEAGPLPVRVNWTVTRLSGRP
jgi:alpha-D-xyloside xylohydrolase